MRRQMAASCFGLALWVLPAGGTSAAPATVTGVFSDPHFEAWHRALQEEASQVRAVRQNPDGFEFCGSHDELREIAFRKHRLRMRLLESLASRGIEPSPPPAGVAPWPWGPGAGTQPHPADYDSAGTAVIVNDGRIVSLNLRGALEVDPFLASQAFYVTHDDEYDFLILFTNFASDLFNGQFLAYHLAVANDIEGLGYRHVLGTDHFDTGPMFTNNSEPGALQSFIHLNALHLYPDDAGETFWRTYTTPAFMAHEVGHRWSARLRLCPQLGHPDVLLGRGSVHWSFFFNSGASVMEGNEWLPAGPAWSTERATIGYGPLDLYLMGMIAHTEIPAGSLWFLANVDSCSPPTDLRGNPISSTSPPTIGVQCDGDRIDFTAQDCIFLANGVRRPLYPETQKEFRVATALVTLESTPAQPAELQKLERMRQDLAAHFHAQTLQRGRLDFVVRSVPAHILFVHIRQGDVEDPALPTTIRTNIELVQRSFPTRLEDIEVSLHYSIAGPFTEVPMQRHA
ncbi:MAG: hypothetical protein ACE5G2_11090, partial [Candidatus Krumholzibacteriia bacterium]